MVSCLEGIFIAKEKLVIFRSLGPCPSNPSNPQTKGRSTDIRATCKSEEEARRNKKPGSRKEYWNPVGRVLPGLQGLHEATRNLSEMMVKVVVVMMGVLAMIMMVTVVAIANDNDGDSCGRDHAHNDNDNDHDGKMLSYGNVSKAFSIVFTQPQSASPLSR